MSIQNEIDRINDGVDDIKAAITEMGGTVADGAKVDQLGAAVRAIPTGGMTQEEADERYVKLTPGNKIHNASDWVYSENNAFKRRVGLRVYDGTIGFSFVYDKGSYRYINLSLDSSGKVVVNGNSEAIGEMKESLGIVSPNEIYPVNSVKMWYDNEDHSKFLGFTWVRCLQNRFPAGIGGEAEFSSIGQTGGEKTHALTTSEAPPIDSGNYLITGGTRERWIDGYNGSAGQPHNNLPPYEVVSFWRRTA